MHIEEEVMIYLQNQNLDDDVRQNIYLELLEMEESNIPAMALAVKMAKTRGINQIRDDMRRAELEQENADQINSNLGMVGVAADPLDELIAEEQMLERAEELSPLLRNTLEALVFEGLTPEELADREGVDRNAIDQRVHNIKRKLTGEE